MMKKVLITEILSNMRSNRTLTGLFAALIVSLLPALVNFLY